MIGKTISQYKIIEKLGEGGMGEVYLAEDIILNRRVAIKFLPSKATLNDNDRDLFLKEAQASAAINHPNVCIIHDIKEYSDQQFIIMEYVEGQTLSEKIASETLPIEQVINYSIQIISAIQAAHDKKIIHKDIKSDNIMISTSNNIKVMDFGLAEIKGSIDLINRESMVGTLAYMSPEQIEGQKIDARTDIFSFGVVLYEMLSGERPFNEDYESALIYSILNEDPKSIEKLNNKVPLDLNRIVNKALDKNKSDRYQRVVDILLDFKSLDEQINRLKYLRSGTNLKTQLAKNPIQSIVVNPLKNYSDNPEQEYFVDGMTESLTSYLAKFHSLRTISHTSAMHYKAKNKSISQMAQELNIDAVVEGSVLRVDNRVRISVQLINAATEEHLWVENYDREFKDILVLQSDIAKSIAKEINLKLTQKEKMYFEGIHSVNPESYDAYLKGRFHWYKLSPQNVQKALDYFSLSLKKDPESPLANTGIAIVEMAKAYWGYIPPRESMPKAKLLLLEAIKMDDTLEEAHDGLARILYFYDWEWKGAEKEFKCAIKLNPNKADAHLFYSSFLRSMGRGDEAMSEAKKGLELDPLNNFSHCHYVGQLMYQQKYDEAILQLTKIAKQESDSPFLHRYLWICFQQKHQYDDAIEAAKNYFSVSEKNKFSKTLSKGYLSKDYHGAMKLLADSMEKYSNESYVQPVWIARVYAYAKQKDKALGWLEIAYKERDSLMVNLNSSTDWEILKDEQFFKDVLNKMKFPH